MSKSKNLKYIAEGQRRMKVRKDKRNNEYRSLSAEASSNGCGIGGVKYGLWNSWADSSSPTGYSQNCEMGGQCEFPCNGDC